MGVCFNVVCGECKEFIDINKARGFYEITNHQTPNQERRESFGPLDQRAFWFVWQHRGHKGITITSDHDDDWFDKRAYLKEVWEFK